MTYEVALTPTAEADLRRVGASVARRIVAKLRWLAENFETTRVEALTGDRRGVFKLRVGAYRVVYTREAANRRIVVHFVRHRRAVYKTKPVSGR